MSYRYERKGFQPGADYESGHVAAVTARGQYDSADDVFGNEEGAQVRSILIQATERRTTIDMECQRFTTGP